MNSEFIQIPIIDIGPLEEGNESKINEVVKQIANACTHVGFFYVVNHGISLQKLQLMLNEADRFFRLEKQLKMEINISKSANHR
jgi:isopenicillin N synthase-like dioxygenase